jgi:hypothetical protein
MNTRGVPDVSLLATISLTMRLYMRMLQSLDGVSLRFHVMSDFHLEVGDQYQNYQIPVRAPYLILAGDIGRLQDYEKYLSFIARQCANFEMVCLVLGNHEFYGLSRSDGLTQAHMLQGEKRTLGNLKVVDRRGARVGPSLYILGRTLQSHIGPQSQADVEGRVEDFQRISVGLSNNIRRTRERRRVAAV